MVGEGSGFVGESGSMLLGEVLVACVQDGLMVSVCPQSGVKVHPVKRTSRAQGYAVIEQNNPMGIYRAICQALYMLSVHREGVRLSPALRRHADKAKPAAA